MDPDKEILRQRGILDQETVVTYTVKFYYTKAITNSFSYTLSLSLKFC